MIIYINSKSLGDVIAGKASALIASAKTGVVANEQTLYTIDELETINSNRIADALEALVTLGERAVSELKGKRKP